MEEQKAVTPEQLLSVAQTIKESMDASTGDVKETLELLLGGGAGVAANAQVLQTRTRDPGKPDYGIGSDKTEETSNA